MYNNCMLYSIELSCKQGVEFGAYYEAVEKHPGEEHKWVFSIVRNFLKSQFCFVNFIPVVKVLIPQISYYSTPALLFIALVFHYSTVWLNFIRLLSWSWQDCFWKFLQDIKVVRNSHSSFHEYLQILWNLWELPTNKSMHMAPREQW